MQSIALHLVTFAMLVLAGEPTVDHSRVLSPFPGGFSFSGSWNCAGTFRKDKAHKAVFTGALAVGDTWLELTERDLEPATGYLAKYLIGFDPRVGQLVEFDASSFGASVYYSDEGWKKGKLTMRSRASVTVNPPFLAGRFIYSVTGKKTFTVDWQIQKAVDAPWLVSDHLECEKAI